MRWLDELLVAMFWWMMALIRLQRSTTSAPSTTFRLMDLPAEVRAIIFTFAIDNWKDHPYADARAGVNNATLFPYGTCWYPRKYPPLPPAVAGRVRNLDPFKIRYFGPPVLLVSRRIREEALSVYPSQTCFTFHGHSIPVMIGWLRDLGQRRGAAALQFIRWMYWQGVSNLTDLKAAVSLYISLRRGELHPECKIMMIFKDFEYHAQARFNLFLRTFDTAWDEERERFYLNDEVEARYRRMFQDGWTDHSRCTWASAGTLGSSCEVDCTTESRRAKDDYAWAKARMRMLGADDEQSRCFVQCPRLISPQAPRCTHNRMISEPELFLQYMPAYQEWNADLDLGIHDTQR